MKKIVWLLAILAMGFVSGRGQNCDPVPPGLVGWWQAEGNALDAISGSAGTLYPGTTFYPTGMVGQAFSFDGVTGCVMNTNTPPLTNIQNNFTIEFWAYPQQGFTMLPEDANDYELSGQSFAIFPDWGGNSGAAGAGVSVGTNGISVVEHAPDYMPSLLSYTNYINGWVHVAVVYTNKQPTLYVNGVNVRTGITSPRAFVYPSKDFGSSYSSDVPWASFSTYGPYKGLLDEVSIYNRALDAAEIAGIYNAGSAGKCVAPIPPTIFTQPGSQSVSSGSTTTLSVVAGGTPPLTYQWVFNGNILPGATAATLTLTNIQASEAGDYAVDITNFYGGVVSSNASVTVSVQPPIILTQPVNRSVLPGASITFGVVAGGSSPLSYQWGFNGTNISGATNAVLTLTNVQVYQAGNYAVLISNPFGNRESTNAVLTVNSQPPVILRQPINQSVLAGGNATFGVIMGGLGPLSYQWFFDGTNIIGATHSTLVLNNVQPLQAGNYSVRISGPGGITNSANGVLTVNVQPPIILGQPANQSVFAGGSASFGVVAGGSAPLSYQWSLNGTAISNATNSLLTLTNIQPAQAGNYAVAISSPYGSTNSASALLTVNPARPVIVTQPADQSISAGAGAAFDVTATGATPLSYQWSFDGTNISNATNALLVLTAVQPAQAGYYSVVVTNYAGFATSQTAQLVVGPFPACDPTPAGLVGWWQAEGNALETISGATGTVYPGTTFVPGMAGQCFNFDGVNGCVMNTNIPALTNIQNNFTMEFWAYPQQGFTMLPEDVNDYELSGQSFAIFPDWDDFDGGAGVGVSVGTNGISVVEHAPDYMPSLLSYSNNIQGWAHIAVVYVNKQPTLYVNGVNVRTGIASPRTYVYPSKDFGSSYGGVYWASFNSYGPYKGLLDEVSIYNRALTADEIAAVYNAGAAGKCIQATPPIITAQPVNQTVLAGTTATFSAGAAGSIPLSYQWSFNGTNIDGATNAILTLTGVQAPQSGYYSVLITNIAGATNSQPANLAISATPVCDPTPSGLVGWWQAEGDALDTVSEVAGTLYSGTSYAPGMVGRAFSFDGVNGCVMNTGTSPLTSIQNTFTVEFWAYPQQGFTMLPENLDDYELSGQSFAIFPEWGGNDGKAGMGVSVGTNGISVVEHAPGYMPSLLSYGKNIQGWVHIAVVYTNKQPTLYVNGVNVRTGLTSSRTYVYPSKTFGSSYDTSSGYSFTQYGPYKGLLDEIGIYNRALSATEIVGIYNAGSAGKCPAPPEITGQPTNETVLVGGVANLSVTASGGGSLSFQWSFNGTNLIGATNALLTLTDVQLDQAGAYVVAVSNSNGTTNSDTAVLNVGLPPVISQEPADQAVISHGKASFTVAASGTGPITYQWQKNGTNLVDGGNISGSTTTNLTVTGVTLNDVGNYEVVVTSPYATTNSSVATLALAQTALSLGSTNGMSGGTITVPVFVNAVGLENTVVASIGYNPTNLVLQNVQLAPGMTGAYLIEVDSQTNNGYVGFAIQLNTGVALPVGMQEIALLNFVALPVTNNTIVNLTFGNVPNAGQVLDNNFDLLPVTYAGGTISLIPAEYEADVYPRFSGDHQVSAQDWGELGRMVAGLDIPTNSDELLRADCAPRNAPDGVLTVADWVQAGRYALGLDPLTLVSQAQPAIASKVQPRDQSGSVRTLQIATVPDARGQVVSVPVQLVCVTNENAAGMTIQYDVNKLKLLNVSLGSAMSGAKLDINTNKAVGEIGLALALSPGVGLPAGTNQVAVIQFLSSTNASGPVPVGLDSSVVTLQVVDRFATPLPASYANGSVALPPRPTVGAKATASNLQLSWEASDGSFQVQTASSPTGPWTTVVLPLATNGASVNVMVTTTNKQQYYRLVGQ